MQPDPQVKYYATGLKTGKFSANARRYDSYEECLADSSRPTDFAISLVIIRETLEPVATITKTVSCHVEKVEVADAA